MLFSVFISYNHVYRWKSTYLAPDPRPHLTDPEHPRHQPVHQTWQPQSLNRGQPPTRSLRAQRTAASPTKCLAAGHADTAVPPACRPTTTWPPACRPTTEGPPACRPTTGGPSEVTATERRSGRRSAARKKRGKPVAGTSEESLFSLGKNKHLYIFRFSIAKQISTFCFSIEQHILHDDPTPITERLAGRQKEHGENAD